MQFSTSFKIKMWKLWFTRELRSSHDTQTLLVFFGVKTSQNSKYFYISIYFELPTNWHVAKRLFFLQVINQFVFMSKALRFCQVWQLIWTWANPIHSVCLQAVPGAIPHSSNADYVWTQSESKIVVEEWRGGARPVSEESVHEREGQADGLFQHPRMVNKKNIQY